MITMKRRMMIRECVAAGKECSASNSESIDNREYTIDLFIIKTYIKYRKQLFIDFKLHLLWTKLNSNLYTFGVGTHF